MERASVNTPKTTPPPNPYTPESVKQPDLDTMKQERLPANFKEDSFDLAEGRAVLRWPEKLDRDSVADLEDWFNLIIRKMQRMTGATPKKKNKPKAITTNPEDGAADDED